MRGKTPPLKNIQPDPVYSDTLVTKLINRTMSSGKKSVAQKQVYRALEQVGAQTGASPLSVFHEALENIRPQMEVRARRIGGAAYQVPREVRGERRMNLAMRWILDGARSQKGRPMHECLADELIAASKNEGAAIKKKLDMHRMAEANKAFAHFAW